METTRHSPSFHELPHDVRFSIFLGVARSYDASGVDEALADIDNLSRTSTAWRATFREHKLLVYRAIVHHAVHPTVHRAAFVAYSVYEEDAERRKMREGCLEHFVLMPDVVQELRSNAWVREVDWNWRPPCVRQILRKHQLFEEMAGLVGSQIESSPASWNDNYETDYVTPSERHRIQRTLYYIEIFFYLQHLRNIELPDTTEELSLYPEWVDNDDLFCGIFTDIFSVVEIEQIRCAITMLMYMSAVVLNKVVSEDLELGLVANQLVDSPDSTVGGRFLQADLRGLFKALLQTEKTRSDRPLALHIFDVLGRGLEATPDHIEHFNFPHDAEVADALLRFQNNDTSCPVARDALSDLVNRRQPSYEDPDDGPTKMWLFAHNDMSDLAGFHCSKLSLQTAGYVFWDEERLIEANMYDFPNYVEGFILDGHLETGRVQFLVDPVDHECFAASQQLRETLREQNHTGKFDYASFKECFETDPESIADIEPVDLHRDFPVIPGCLGCQLSPLAP